jgi:two-component system cell cycle sensor histidine kinase/response regulator CckA
MAAISNIRLQLPDPSGAAPVVHLPLDCLPFPSAVVDANGALLAANSEWVATRPSAAPGADALDWCEPDLRATVLAGVRRAIEDGRANASHEYGPDSARRRLMISVCAAGAVLIDQEAPPDARRKQQSEKMETVGRLVGGVAHDFANLLTLIAGYSDILLNRVGEKDPLRGELDEIRKAANRGARLTAQLLGFTRGQAVSPRPLDLNAVVSDLQRMLALVVGEHVDLETSLSPSLQRIVADPGQMEQVIMNLILNARDAVPAGGRIRIETANDDFDEAAAREHGILPGSYVTLSISDSGHGIDATTMAHIFEPFFTTKEHGKGTGLGLSTVHRIVKETGGNIWVSSQPGAGATFTICLPRAPQSADHGEAPTMPRAVDGGAETLLLVEDEEGVRKLLTHVLHKRGYRVLEAANGDEALRVYERRRADIQLVLTDMVMPHMSGRELGEKLRALSPNLKIIYMSGYTDDVLVRTGALGPGMSFLQKPLRPETLAARVRETLDGKVRAR